MASLKIDPAAVSRKRIAISLILTATQVAVLIWEAKLEAKKQSRADQLKALIERQVESKQEPVLGSTVRRAFAGVVHYAISGTLRGLIQRFEARADSTDALMRSSAERWVQATGQNPENILWELDDSGRIKGFQVTSE